METVKLEMTSDGRFVPAEGVRLSDYNPKELMLVAMCDCAGRTVLAIMEKMKISPLEMEIEGSGRITSDLQRHLPHPQGAGTHQPRN